MSYTNIEIGVNSPQIVNAVIEIPKGTKNKYEYDENWDEIRLDRVLHSSVYYPVDYGFIPQTRADDGDHGDILVITDSPVFPGCVIRAKPIGLLKMTDENGIDNKILAIPLDSPTFKGIGSIDSVNGHTLKEIVAFFEQYKILERKPVHVDGWGTREEAWALISAEHERYIRQRD